MELLSMLPADFLFIQSQTDIAMRGRVTFHLPFPYMPLQPNTLC